MRRRLSIEHRDILRPMHQRDPLVFGCSRVDPGECGERTALFEPLHNRAQPVGRLRMSGAHVVFQVTWIVNEPGCSHVNVREASFVSRISTQTVSSPYHAGKSVDNERKRVLRFRFTVPIDPGEANAESENRTAETSAGPRTR